MTEKLTTEQMREQMPTAIKMARDTIQKEEKARDREYLRTTLEIIIVVALFLLGEYFLGG